MSKFLKNLDFVYLNKIYNYFANIRKFGFWFKTIFDKKVFEFPFVPFAISIMIYTRIVFIHCKDFKKERKMCKILIEFKKKVFQNHWSAIWVYKFKFHTNHKEIW